MSQLSTPQRRLPKSSPLPRDIYCLSGPCTPQFLSANDAYLYDTEGKNYIDFCNGKGSVLLGHNHPSISHALIKHIESNANVVTEPSIEIYNLTAIIEDSLPANYSTRYYHTGSTAVLAAIQTVRQYSGKNMILSAGYHGWDSMWQPAPYILAPNEHEVIDFYFLVELLEKSIESYQGQIAAIIISPDFSYLGEQFYVKIDEISKIHRIPLICDDVKVGFRYVYGSSLSQLNIQADLYIFSKCLSNGGTLSCVAGPEDIMEASNSFTYTGYFDSLPHARASATLVELERSNAQKQIANNGDRFLAVLRQRILTTRLPFEITGNGNLFQFVFGDSQLEHEFYRLSLLNGLYFFASDNQCPSLALTDEVYDEALSRLNNVLNTLESNYRFLRGLSISTDNRFLAAFNQMDGCMNDLSTEDAVDLLERHGLAKALR